MRDSFRAAAPIISRFGAAALALTLLSACTPNQLAPEQMLDQSILAISVAADERGLVLVSGTGKVLFLDQQGTKWETFDTKGIGEAPITFQDDSLYFVDRKNDYRLGERLDKWERPGEEVGAAAIFAIDPKGSFVTLFNWGFAEDGNGYIFNTYSHTGDNVEEIVYDQVLSGFANCGDTVYAVYNPRQGTQEGAADYVISQRSMVKVGPNGSTVPVLNYTPSYPMESDSDSIFPCQDGIAYQIADSYAKDATLAEASSLQDLKGTTLLAWDINNGSVNEVPLHGVSEVNRFEGFLEGKKDPFFLGNLLKDNQLWWIAGTGNVVTTDVETGLTSVQFALENFQTGISPGYFKFSDDYLFRLNISDSEPSTVEVYELATNRYLGNHTLPDLNSQLGDRQFIYDFAITDEAALVSAVGGS